ncbi:MAG: Nucleoside diphosphate kinase [candidate division TA06 bacterium 34_109]|uniref:nucleoside-diphosphate kinase n=1 Tax=candidate division TA06 bacterium 34_109 TaxID=1635277 RepID=A0A101I088_UNCT6|nr:MAG: Nucleoside diphosphate kinase [candidate division TA06 bacterium 34_109]
MEKTLVLIKPEAIERRLVGEIISRLERVGLRLEEIKLLKPAREIVERHYPDNQNWLRNVGSKTIDTYRRYNLNLRQDLGTEDDLEIGQIIRKWLIEHLTFEPVIALVLSGNHAVEVTRKMVGRTVPLFADLGSIRGDFSTDSPDCSTPEKRVLYNLVHASESVEEAQREIALWFGNQN